MRVGRKKLQSCTHGGRDPHLESTPSSPKGSTRSYLKDAKVLLDELAVGD